MSAPITPSPGVPVFLLKTRSSPGDSYEDLFSQASNDFSFEPTFIPVLQHHFDEEGLASVRTALQRKDIGSAAGARYGGIIFTSQRAVEAFAKVIEDGLREHGESWANLGSVPIYSVGPATTRALAAVKLTPSLEVVGSHTGNGDALAAFILSHYNPRYSDYASKPALLFLVGEQRRDIIPKTLMNPALPADQLIQVEEVPVYGTGVMESFPADFQAMLDATASHQARWVVIFSPTGCDAVLNRLDLLDEVTGRAKSPTQRAKTRSTFIATIGPTTRDHLRSNFGFDPDVCADTPSPQGIFQGIVNFMRALEK
ncbi:tetrapyrrole biosynthesis, uroporphyrinogen III synthase [Plectosphaerella plurivora]|uniref:Tetrapyrrole biosynthesis, uroporphyrinogen III synthase n=1 Tax=Plectosphaerella plurivora TaxID=936078 RepID=A0A9P9A986_9PEZI|nr:tetrapyrrole biosynthesis, uroporphyrinogen III synthase [Plectosphaerella plurivora]